MFHDFVFLTTKAAQELYATYAKHLPIVDFHCHLSPKEIAEDKPFESIGQLWLSSDHYKWRLMRSAGICERDITGNASFHKKYLGYIHALSLSPGNPLYHWSHLELKFFFDIHLPICPDTAEEIWQAANRKIQEMNLSPRKLIKMANVTHIATTDDPADSLSYHLALQNDPSFPVVVTPTFRTDHLLLIRRKDYGQYIQKLSAAADTNILDLDTLEAALQKRLDFFCTLGCRFSDVGIPYFPSCEQNRSLADCVFQKALAGEEITNNEYLSFLGYMYIALSHEYQKRNITMQMHLGVLRNVNSRMFAHCGADCGADVAGNTIDAKALCSLLDAMQENGKLPKTILYVLNPASYYAVATAAGSFKNVSLGAAWWHCDHLDGIVENIKLAASLGSLGSAPGMVTDSRSFLSTVRHDYFRRILCSVLGRWMENGECSEFSAAGVIHRVCHQNALSLF